MKREKKETQNLNKTYTLSKEINAESLKCKTVKSKISTEKWDIKLPISINAP